MAKAQRKAAKRLEARRAAYDACQRHNGRAGTALGRSSGRRERGRALRPSPFPLSCGLRRYV